MLGFFRDRRRARLREAPFPPSWQAVLEAQVPYYAVLPAALQEQLRGHIRIFIAEKSFEGCNGQRIDDRVRVVIAAHACILQLNRPPDFYPALQSVLVYPEPFIARHHEEAEDGLVDEVEDVQEGESWSTGAVIFSWPDIETDTRAFDGRNVIFHEFAHQLFDHGGIAMPTRQAQQDWLHLLETQFEAHVQAVERHKRTFLDPYGAEDLAEFFSVITETFFELPHEFAGVHPALYEALAMLYQQNPRDYFPVPPAPQGKRKR
jgi:Mlc titration factor MtfA (ptsG expression regulator)